tara:strand:- start:268 stop:525 length:258 start_codon:yes stop_codon:yes gene_type:complete
MPQFLFTGDLFYLNFTSTLTKGQQFRFYFIDGYSFFAFSASVVLAARLKFLAVGAPLLPGFLIFSPDPAFIRARFLWMFSYKLIH